MFNSSIVTLVMLFMTSTLSLAQETSSHLTIPSDEVLTLGIVTKKKDDKKNDKKFLEGNVKVHVTSALDVNELTQDQSAFLSQALVMAYNKVYEATDYQAEFGNVKAKGRDEMLRGEKQYSYYYYNWYIVGIGYSCRLCSGGSFYFDDDYHRAAFPDVSLLFKANGGKKKHEMEQLFCDILASSEYDGFQNAKDCKLEQYRGEVANE